jgi:hypothetical protein
MPPPTLAIFSNRFTVSFYSCVGMTQKCREKSFTIPFDSNVGKLYVSGSKKERKSIFRKFLWIFPLLVIFIIGAWKYFNYEREKISPVHKVESNHKLSNSVSSSKSFAVESELILKDSHFISFICSADTCVYKNARVPLDFVLFLKSKIDSSYEKTNVSNFGFVTYSMIVDDDTFNFIIDSFSISTKKEKKKDYKNNTEIKLFGSEKK